MLFQVEKDQKNWKILEEVPSTNTYLLEGDFPCGTVCLAKKQNAGRGQYGRSWLSIPVDERAFLCSVLLCLPKDSIALGYLPLFTGLALLKALKAHTKDFSHALPENRGEIKLQLKWPNDIYLSHAKGCGKLGGILVEGKSVKEDINKGPAGDESLVSLVIGVGINWSGEERALRALFSKLESTKAERIEIAPSILYEGAKKTEELPSPLGFLPYFIKAFNKGLLKLQSKNYDFIDEVRKNSYLTGHLLRLKGDNKVYSVKGISEECELLLENMQTGKHRKLRSARESFELL